MAVNERARAWRLRWRSNVLALDTGDAQKAEDRDVLMLASILANLIHEHRPAFEAAQAAHELAVAEWVSGGKQGPRPVNNDPDVIAFRRTRNDYSAFMRTPEYRAAIARSRLNDWSEPSDLDLLEVAGDR
jgi:hypothetical protein